MHKILVIGATGHVGRQLVPLLVQRGASVKAATRTPESYGAASDQVEAVRFDYDQPDTFGPALAGVDRVFMLALPADPLTYDRLTPFVDAAQAAAVQHILMMTAMGVEHDEESPLRQVELYIEASGVPYTFIRPNWFMDNFSTGFIQPMIAEAQSIFLPVDGAKMSFIATQDIAAAAAVILTEPGHRGQAYALTGSQALSYREAAQILSEVAGYPINYVPVTAEATRQGMREAGWGEAELDYFAKLFTAVNNGFAAPVIPTLAQLLGQKPTTFREFALAHAQSWN